MKMPEGVRKQVGSRLWAMADAAGWDTLNPTSKAVLYQRWTDDPEIGGVLVHYMSRARVRVYLKDTLLKNYTRSRLADEKRPLRALGLGSPTASRETFEKPYGVLLQDGRMIAWGGAEEWRHVILALYERAYGKPGTSIWGMALLKAGGRFREPAVRAMVEGAAHALGIPRVVWLETHGGHTID